MHPPVTKDQWKILAKDRVQKEAEKARKDAEEHKKLVEAKADEYLDKFWELAATGAIVVPFFIVRDVSSDVEAAIERKLSENGWKGEIQSNKIGRMPCGDEVFARELWVVS